MTIKKLAAVLLMTAVIFGATSAFGVDYKTSIKLVLKSGSASAGTYDEAYIIAIPDALTITQEGWNSIGNITASYNGNNAGFDPDKKLVVTAGSTTDFKLTADGISDTIGYTVRTSDSDTAATTTFTFKAAEINADGGTSKPIGVHVESFSDKSNATYTDTITYTAEVQDAVTVTNLSTITGAYTAQDGETITGTAGSDAHITVAAGATITLKDATITSITNDSSHNWAGITCAGNATIILEGTNEVKGGYSNYSGIFIAENATLTIKGEGSLTASSNGYGAGIGSALNGACGNIVIEGGSITATGGMYAAGIGGGSSGSCGDITITDGVTSVTATKGDGAENSIGAGDGGTCGTVTIGGTVYWDGSSYQNGGDSVLTQSTYTYTPTNG